jgi:hypothetical protein
MLTALARRNIRNIRKSANMKTRVARENREDSGLITFVIEPARLITFVIEPARLKGYIHEGAET